MRRVPAALAGALALVPGPAAACAVCVGSAFGDRSYSWPYLGLILMPFVVAGIVGGVLAWHFGWRPRHLAALARRDPSPRTHTETT